MRNACFKFVDRMPKDVCTDTSFSSWLGEWNHGDRRIFQFHVNILHGFSEIQVVSPLFFTFLMFLEFGLIWQDCKYAETARCGKFESSEKSSRPLTNASIPDLRKPISMYTGLTLLWSITSSSLMLFVYRFVKADISRIRIAKGHLSYARLVRRYSSKVRLQNAFYFFGKEIKPLILRGELCACHGPHQAYFLTQQTKISENHWKQMEGTCTTGNATYLALYRGKYFHFTKLFRKFI